jgi:hypothetical protein
MRHVVLSKQLDQPSTSTWSRSSTTWYVKQINLLSFKFANMVVAQWEGVVGLTPPPDFQSHPHPILCIMFWRPTETREIL